MNKETPQEAARRLAAKAIEQGHVPEGLHEYRDATGRPVHWVIRCKHPNGDKWMRPMLQSGGRYAIGKPEAPATGWPLYRLPELLQAPAEPVWFVEGEHCADHLARLGVVVTTTGGASTADGADLAPLAGRTVHLWPDNDAAGAGYADALRARLRPLGCTVHTIDVAALELPEAGDVVDWLARHPNATAADLDALPTLAEPAEPKASSPEPLRRPVPPPEPYPIAELGEVLAPAAESLRRVIQAPDAICGAAVLAAASLATQALANVTDEGRVHPLSLWLLSVAGSGERKSAVDGEAMQAADAFEKELAHAYDGEAEAHAAEVEEWEARRAHAKGTTKKKAGGAGLADALRGIGPKPPAPLLPRVIVGDFTAEGLSKLLADGWPSVGAFTDEAALVFGGHGMSKEAVTRTAGTLCKLWDKGVGDRVRALDGATKLYGRRLALHLMAQPVIAERALADDVLAGQGFLARCLLAWPESTAGRRPYRAENLRNDAALGRMAHRLGELHRLPLPLAQGSRQELNPRPLPLSPEAKALWWQFHDRIEAEMKVGGRFATVHPWASKTPEQALRIAGVLTLVDCTNAASIEADTMERACELALWHLNEATRLAGTAALPAEVLSAEALLNWCHETGRRQLCSTEALQRGPARIRDRQTFGRAMQELVQAGWAHPVEGGAVIDGHHRRYVWRIVPGQG